MIRFIITSLTLSSLALPAQTQPRDQEALFGLDRIWDIHLTVHAEALEKMYPARGRRRPTQGSRFPYVKALAQIGKHQVMSVGLRFKGQSTWSYSAGTLKRSLKIDFDRFVEGQKFLGCKKLNLNNNVTDPTQIREAVTYSTYRDAGIRASRTAFARVFLTISGRCEREYLGLYTIIEQVDRRVMKRWFGSKKGLLAKPATVLGYQGDEWNERYESRYRPKTRFEPEHTLPLVALAKLMRTDDPTFAAGLEKFLDVDQFLRYLAVTVITAATDSPLNLPHNFYLAVPHQIGKVVWIPWDLNLTLGGWGRAGPNQDRLSLLRPTSMRVMHRVLDVGTNEDRYLEHVRELIGDACSAKAMQRRIDQARTTTRAAIAQEASRSSMVTNVDRSERIPRDSARFGGTLTLDEFVTRREASVHAQLAGESEGMPGAVRWGSRGQPAAASTGTLPTDVRIRQLIAKARLPKEQDLFAIDAVVLAGKQVFASLDLDQSGQLHLDELKRCLPTLRGAPKYLERRRNRQARRILRDLDSDGSQSASLAEWQERTRRWFLTWDRDKNDRLTRRELRRAWTPPLQSRPLRGR